MHLSFRMVILAAACSVAAANAQDSPPVGVATESTRLANEQVAGNMDFALYVFGRFYD